MLTPGLGSAPFLLIALTTLLGTAGKVLGGYAGARLGDQGRWEGLRVGVLMNTRGLTEIIVLQVAYDVGILFQTITESLVGAGASRRRGHIQWGRHLRCLCWGGCVTGRL